jgi:peptide deformylase
MSQAADHVSRSEPRIAEFGDPTGGEEPIEALAEPLPLRFFGDQVLRRVAAPVTDITAAIVELAERMLATQEVEAGVGLAAPQVGRSIRLFTHSLVELAPPVLINPEILEVSGEWVYNEGCLSIPGLYYDLVRPKVVGVRAWGLDGELLEFEADELLSRVIQHELDHLNGVLFVDRLSGDARVEAESELASRVKGTLGVADPLLTHKPVPYLRKHHPGGPAPHVVEGSGGAGGAGGA